MKIHFSIWFKTLKIRSLDYGDDKEQKRVLVYLNKQILIRRKKIQRENKY